MTGGVVVAELVVAVLEVVVVGGVPGVMSK